MKEPIKQIASFTFTMAGFFIPVHFLLQYGMEWQKLIIVVLSSAVLFGIGEGIRNQKSEIGYSDDCDDYYY